MKTILVTGGAGYIGSHCVKELLQHGYRCIVIDNLSTGHEDAILSQCFIKVDLADTVSLNQLFHDYTIDGVIHFAASIEVGESVANPAKYYANNIANSLNLLNTMKKHNVTRIVFSSTCAIYGDPQYLPLDEDHPKVPINPYGMSKFVIEQALKDYSKAYGFSYIALRYFNVAGCDMDGQLGERHFPETHIIPLVLQVALGVRDHITIFGHDYATPDGTCIRDYIHVDDIARAHRLALEKMLTSTCTEAINLGIGRGISVQEIITTAEKITGKKIAVVAGERRAGDPPILVASNQKSTTILNWRPIHTDLETIIASAWRWMQNNNH